MMDGALNTHQQQILNVTQHTSHITHHTTHITHHTSHITYQITSIMVALDPAEKLSGSAYEYQSMSSKH